MEEELTDELPDAAWFAEHIMRYHPWINWKTGDYDGPLPMFCPDPWEDGSVAVYLEGNDPSFYFNPKVSDADALHLWRQMPGTKALRIGVDFISIVITRPYVFVDGPLEMDEREIICRAAYAWWLAHKKED